MQTFKKEERLSEKKIIEKLFERGCGFYVSPFKVLWVHADFESKYPAKVMMAVSGKNFRKAVDRNRIKRLMREAYRKNKHILYEALQNSSEKYAFMLLYTGKIIIPFRNMESKIILILQRLVKENEDIVK
ncbi:MAG: ribonuclease P protein component [Bacteroidales bacterium]